MSPLQRLELADWSGVPHNLRDQIQAYVANGTPPKSPFLGDILTGDLRRACSRVPERETLFAIVDFLGLYVPSEAWGHAAACVRWGELGGHRGIEATDTSRMYENRRRGAAQLWPAGRGDDEDS